MMTETTFSHDSDLEEAVIGACMIERAAMPLVVDKLRPEMFYEGISCNGKWKLSVLDICVQNW